MNGIMYVFRDRDASGGAMPKDLPPTQHGARLSRLVERTTARSIAFITRFMWSAVSEAKREASPTAAIIDSQSVKSAEKGGPVSTRMALMRARRSKARSATFL